MLMPELEYTLQRWNFRIDVRRAVWLVLCGSTTPVVLLICVILSLERVMVCRRGGHVEGQLMIWVI
jgi:hypothetical protein